MDINKASLKVLMRDRYATAVDIDLCERAIRSGITEYSGGKISDRLALNQEIMATIDAELARRNLEVV